MPAGNPHPARKTIKQFIFSDLDKIRTPNILKRSHLVKQIGHLPSPMLCLRHYRALASEHEKPLVHEDKSHACSGRTKSTGPVGQSIPDHEVYPEIFMQRVG